MKPSVIQSSLTFHSIHRTRKWKAVEQFFTMVLFVFQFYTVLENFVSFGLGTTRSERVNKTCFVFFIGFSVDSSCSLDQRLY